VESIEGEDLVEKVVLKDTQTGERTELQVQGVFVFAGMKPDTELFKGLVDMDEKGYIKTDEYMRTNVPGVFAAGDCRVKWLRQVVTAAADGAQAAVAAERYDQYQDSYDQPHIPCPYPCSCPYSHDYS